jgi:DNA segregation ATPase FtsK/SpoIIIE and related proteins
MSSNSLNSDIVNVVFDINAWNEFGHKAAIPFDFSRYPMLLTVGGTGSGKTYFLSLLMAKIGKHIADVEIYLCDFKNMDFRSFADCPHHWAYEACDEGLNAFYESFQARLHGEDTSTNRKFLVFDEWAAFILFHDKKVSEEVKRKLSTLLMMGRGVQHHVIIGLQRADAQLFPMGGRDQFGAILALGNLSKEQKLMLFPDFRDDMTVINGRGEGYLSLDGEPLRRVRVPTVTNVECLNAAIRDGLTH